MTVSINIILPAAMAFLALVATAQAETACNEKLVSDRLTAMEDAFRQPGMQAKLSAARKDAGAVDGACESLIRTDTMVRAVLGER